MVGLGRPKGLPNQQSEGSPPIHGINRLKSIPKASVLPFIGDSIRLFEDGPRLAQERSEKLGPIWESWVFGERTFFVVKADMLKWCLNKEYDAVECAQYQSQY